MWTWGYNNRGQLGDGTTTDRHTPVEVDCSGHGIQERKSLPASLSISAYPNPFNSAVSITAPADAEIEIFDINGRNVAHLEGGEQVWRPEASIGSGVYLVRARIGEQSITKRVVYLK